nr:MAG TPA: hypothetical protein [Caudoviricetes sp.]
MRIELCGPYNTQGFPVVQYGFKFVFEIAKDDVFSCHHVVCPHNKHFVFMYSIMRSVIGKIDVSIYKVSLHLERLFYECIGILFQLFFFLLNVGTCTTNEMELADDLRLGDIHIVCLFRIKDLVYGSLSIVNSTILCSTQRVATHDKHGILVVAATNSNFYMNETRKILFLFRTERTVRNFNLINALLFKSVSQLVGDKFSSLQQHLATVYFYRFFCAFIDELFGPCTSGLLC